MFEAIGEMIEYLFDDVNLPVAIGLYVFVVMAVWLGWKTVPESMTRAAMIRTKILISTVMLPITIGICKTRGLQFKR